VTDVLPALRTYLLADDAVAALCSTRVFASELPKAEASSMPRECVVLVGSGGVERFATDTIQRPRVDVYSYGQTFSVARQVDRAVYSALKALMRKRIGEVLIHSVGLSGGPLQLRDGDGDWPVQMRSMTVAADEREIEE
jgi:hypothetical protein